MSTPRRRIIRPTAVAPPPSPRLNRLRTRQARDQQLLAAWMVRLKRAFHRVEHYQRRIAGLDRSIRREELSHVRLIEVLVSPTGETKLETRGFTGAACQQATQALAAALGLAVSETLTAEYYQPAEQQAGLATQSDR